MPERYFSVSDVRARFFPSRSTRWIKNQFRAGEHGPVLVDRAGLQISELAVDGRVSCADSPPKLGGARKPANSMTRNFIRPMLNGPVSATR